jgi:hypothetical protein
MPVGVKCVVEVQGYGPHLNWLECEILRYARRMVQPFTPDKIRKHLRISPNSARGLLHCLVEKQYLVVASGKERARTFTLRN